MKSPDERRLLILKYIVERYIETGEPVGSKEIALNLSSPISSATIRNDMAALEQMGYLEQPHVSAGRIPSYQGYRFYISHLMTREPLSEDDRARIDSTITRGDLNPKTLIANASDLLAELTDCAIVSALDQMEFSIITRVEVIPAGRRLYALLMITSSGAVENRVCRLEFDLTEEQINFFARFIKENLTGTRIEDLTDERIVELGLALGSYTVGLAPLLYGVYDISSKLKKRNIEIKNERSLLAKGEIPFQNMAQLMEQKEKLDEILNSAFSGVNVVFGNDQESFIVTNSSLIFSSFKQGERPLGALGVLGPMRLDYGRIIPYVEYLAETVSRLMTEGVEEDRSKPGKIGRKPSVSKSDPYR